MSAPTHTPETPPATPAKADWIGWLEERMPLTELFSFVTHFGILYTPVDTRRPLREELRRLAQTPLVSYARWPHILGLLTALLFGLEFVTGLLLAFYHQPTIAGAYDSTRSIVRDVPLGWLVHQVHAWGSFALVAVVLLRLFRLFWDKLYRAPRELLWFAGVGLAFLALQLDFTGLLLPWDVHSYWSAIRGLEVVWALPIVGPILSFLVGGKTMSEDVMGRFYVLHIIVLPLLYLAFVYVTFATMRIVGLSRTGIVDPPKTTLKRHFADLLILVLVLFAVLVTLATLVPWPFHGAADPYVTPKGTRPPWYLLAPYALFRLPIPSWILGLPLLAIGFAVPLLPVIERMAGAKLDDTKLRRAVLAVLGLWFALSIVGVFVDRR